MSENQTTEGHVPYDPARFPVVGWQRMDTAPRDRPILMARPHGLPERMCWLDGFGLTPGWYLTDRRPREASWFVPPEREHMWRWMDLPEPPNA